MAELSRPTDPGAVRVRLEAGSRLAEEPAIEVTPAPEPLRMTNPTVGTGPLGGHAMTPPEVAAGPAVLAQRQVLVDGGACDARLRPLAAGRHVLEEGTSGSRVILEPYTASGGLRSREVLVDGFRFIVEVEPARVAALRERATSARGAAAHAGPLQVKAIIPGKVVAVSVKAGDAVTAGQQLLVVEAMKMQNELRAPRDGTIERVSVAAGVSIEIGDLLVVIS